MTTMNSNTRFMRAKNWITPVGLITASLLLAGAPTYLPPMLDAVGLLPQEAHALTQAELEAQIKDRSARLKEVQRKLDAAKTKLNSATSERRSLQREVNILEAGITQLELGIEEDELTIDRLGFEITSLNGDIISLRDRMSDKQDAIAALLRDVQKREGINPLLVLFKSKNLTTGLREAREITALQARVGSDLGQLRELQSSVITKITSTSDKRVEIESRRVDLENKIAIIADQKESRSQVLDVTKDKEGSYQAQLSAIQKQQKDIANEVEALEAKLRAQIKKSELPSDTVLIKPTDGVITQGYGSTSFARTGYAGRWHNGIDIGAPIGTPIYAAADGTLLASGNQDSYCPRGAYGRFVVLSHNNGLVTLYAHMSRIVASDSVKKGDVIGYVGNSGYATGPHLHFTVYAKSTFAMGGSRVCGPMPRGGDVNPFNYL